jgi:hypothetical protein
VWKQLHRDAECDGDVHSLSMSHTLASTPGTSSKNSKSENSSRASPSFRTTRIETALVLIRCDTFCRYAKWAHAVVSARGH